MTVQQSDVLIVGGGLMGSAAAFFLRQRGQSVTLLERDQIGQYASGVNFGNVRRQGRYLGQLELANRSWALWKRLPELIDDDLEFIASGHMRVCYREDEIAELEAYAAAPEARQLDLKIYRGRELHERFPFLGPDVKGGSYAPHDGHANPRLAAPAFARAAVRAGARIEERTEVAEVQKVGGGFRVGTTDGRQFSAERLLITAGAWGQKLSEQFGEPVPLDTNGPQMAVTEPVPYALPTVIGVYTKIPEEVIYFRQIPRGNIIIGGGYRSKPDMLTRRAQVEPRSILNQIQQMRRLLPGVGNLNIIRVWSGIEGYLPDSLPIMGPSGQVDGLYYAFGFCGHGFQLGPGVGDVMAELIATGSTSTPIEPFSIRRFAGTTAQRSKAS
ncbi:NAD(P)/FAD-dependent oxidoreductase [Pseudomonas chlororaphis]|jgi:sarcosine oxidase subunit beta|uniref:FAD-binding oxidoreductase n=1 Tax=Pseudomonas chlororaphis subsp. aurantiaca TaxID=86192 RepID=A0AAJ0ZF92_9PSED|nr:FAD-binding oxidoreductase [Pseudomonas chlororaphis]AZD22515.1 Opine oxidase subunit B [Pseudomonas chlororaphis subsp. aurantiaca]AZD48720.1 Opine oxidase subunit B [Pseudomonas chlororaphis subsp. aurantiaca]AZD79864.1 Opine oxidase subunit B [Pseudomonas chlororaphis subsp. aurantiaca]AZD99219.1 Opine oxidase subunit B [Pseudomonas chlororaphis subsp. aureofaciens]AZE17616.1 Opine oxidase subunit B [Pseudomonas chlororaphis subsp. aureofaciens]